MLPTFVLLSVVLCQHDDNALLMAQAHDHGHLLTPLLWS